MFEKRLTRRNFVAGSSVGAAACLAGPAWAGESPEAARSVDSYVTQPPNGFVPWVSPGRVVKATGKGSFSDLMQPNELWPKPEVARRLLEKAMMDLTGASNLVEAMKRFIHREDVVAIKPNGIAGQKGQTMSVNFELIEPVVEALIELGVKPGNITVFEQYPSFLAGTRVNVRKWQLPSGVKTGVHQNDDHPMPKVRVYQGIPTRYCRFLTDATAVIDMTMIKDHSICGYTGTLKNITHGTINNPESHHAHGASPQIALLYNHPIVTSRVRLHITDAFKVMFDRGPLDKGPRTRVGHGSVYVSTDPVAMDVIGWQLVERERKERGLPTLESVYRKPRYLQTAGELGLGVFDPKEIRLMSAEV